MIAKILSKLRDLVSRLLHLSNDEWISVDDKLPVIPEGKHGITVLVVKFDPVYDEITNGKGQSVTDASWMKPKDYDDFMFCEMLISFADHEEPDKRVTWSPCFDEITHWKYMPLPPPRNK